MPGKIKHGHSVDHVLSLTYKSWRRMKARCLNKSSASYHLYGARGIRFCDEWKDFSAFLSDMGERPSANHSLDRIDANGIYEKRNCRWATPTQQARNTRRNVFVEFRGEKKCMSEWCQILNFPRQRAEWRLAHGWSPEHIFSTKTHERNADHGQGH